MHTIQTLCADVTEAVSTACPTGRLLMFPVGISVLTATTAAASRQASRVEHRWAGTEAGLLYHREYFFNAGPPVFNFA